MQIEKAVKDDVKTIYEIELSNYGEDEATEIETFTDMVNFPDQYCGYSLYVAKENDIKGFYCSIEENGNVDLVDIAVSKSYQGSGFGRKLLNHCLEVNDDKLIHLIVRADNLSAIKLYESCGFIKTEELEHYYDDCIGLKYVRTIK